MIPLPLPPLPEAGCYAPSMHPLFVPKLVAHMLLLGHGALQLLAYIAQM